MSIPTYDQFLLPLLRLVADGIEHLFSDITETLADQFRLTEEDKMTLLPSGSQTVLKNRIGWAKTYLTKALMLDAPRRGAMKITSRGLEVLANNPPALDKPFLLRYPEFQQFQARTKTASAIPDTAEEQGDSRTPIESIEAAMDEIRSKLASDLIEKVKSCSPQFFERLVVDVLVRMGYGGNFADAAQAVGRTGDCGIDGIIKEDPLGLDRIYVQAKRWEKSVGSPEIFGFIGALQKQHAKKGVFITSSEFTKSAFEAAEGLDTKIVLIDGKRLAEIMMDYDVGCSLVRSYDVKRVDPDYFVDED